MAIATQYRKNITDVRDRAEIHLDADEAIVVFELLARWSDRQTIHTPAAECFESTAEGAVLNNLLAALETQLAAPFKADYLEILTEARSRLAGQ